MDKFKFNDIYGLNELKTEDITIILNILYKLEDNQRYENKYTSNLINYLQKL